MSPCNEENNAICGNLPSSMRPTCPSHLSLFAVMYADKVATPHDFLICSLVCRSDSLTPRMLLRQLESSLVFFLNCRSYEVYAACSQQSRTTLRPSRKLQSVSCSATLATSVSCREPLFASSAFMHGRRQFCMYVFSPVAYAYWILIVLHGHTGHTMLVA